MSTSVKTGRAWVAAIVTTLLVVVLLAVCGLLWEWLEDRDIAELSDPDSVIGTYLYGPMAPVGAPGLIGDREFSDSIAQLGGGLVPVVVLVFLFTWVAGRAARAGSSVTVLFGAWLGTIIGTGLGGLASLQVFIWQNDANGDLPGMHQIRIGRIENGLYWGALAGLLVGLVGMMAFAASRRSADEPLEDAAPHHLEPESEPVDPASYPPPPDSADPVPGTPPETVRAPNPPPDHSR